MAVVVWWSDGDRSGSGVDVSDSGDFTGVFKWSVLLLQLVVLAVTGMVFRTSDDGSLAS